MFPAAPRRAHADARPAGGHQPGPGLGGLPGHEGALHPILTQRRRARSDISPGRNLSGSGSCSHTSGCLSLSGRSPGAAPPTALAPPAAATWLPSPTHRLSSLLCAAGSVAPAQNTSTESQAAFPSSWGGIPPSIHRKAQALGGDQGLAGSWKLAAGPSAFHIFSFHFTKTLRCRHSVTSIL